jgi:hypothetical protein
VDLLASAFMASQGVIALDASVVGTGLESIVISVGFIAQMGCQTVIAQAVFAKTNGLVKSVISAKWELHAGMAQCLPLLVTAVCAPRMHFGRGAFAMFVDLFASMAGHRAIVNAVPAKETGQGSAVTSASSLAPMELQTQPVTNACALEDGQVHFAPPATSSAPRDMSETAPVHSV